MWRSMILLLLFSLGCRTPDNRTTGSSYSYVQPPGDAGTIPISVGPGQPAPWGPAPNASPCANDDAGGVTCYLTLEPDGGYSAFTVAENGLAMATIAVSASAGIVFTSLATTNDAGRMADIVFGNQPTAAPGQRGGSVTLAAQDGDGLSTNGGNVVLRMGNADGGTSGALQLTNATISTTDAGAGSLSPMGGSGPTYLYAKFVTIYVNGQPYKIGLYNP